MSALEAAARALLDHYASYDPASKSPLWAALAEALDSYQREPLDVGLAAIVRRYLWVREALPDVKPHTMPTEVWDARVREVTNARVGVEAFLREYDL